MNGIIKEIISGKKEGVFYSQSIVTFDVLVEVTSDEEN